MQTFYKTTTSILLFFFATLLLGCSSDVPAQGNNTVFIWNFDKPKQYVYKLKYTTESELGGSHHQPKRREVLGTDLIVKVKANKAADVIFKNSKLIESSMFKGRELKEHNQMTSQKIQIRYQDYPANGQIERFQRDLRVGNWFPLPPYDFAPGGSAKMPIKLPYQANGSLLFVRGTSTLKYLRKEKKAERNCAVIFNKIDISDLKVPEELGEEYKCSYKGEGTYYFDLDNQCFVSAKITVNVENFAKMKTPRSSSLSTMDIKGKSIFEYDLVEVKE